MEITVKQSWAAMIDGADADAIATTDRAASCREYERLLSAEIRQIYPTASVAVEFYDGDHEAGPCAIALDGAEGEYYAVSDNVQYLAEQVFSTGLFWVSK